jgi:hypothetical protein
LLAALQFTCGKEEVMSKQSWEERQEQKRLWNERRKERPEERPEEIRIAPSVDFEPTEFHLNLPFDSPPRLSYEVRLAKDEMIELSSGFSIIDKENPFEKEENRKNYRPLKGSLLILAQNDEPSEGGIGRIIYWPADGAVSFVDTYSVEVLVPKVTVDELLAAAHLGRLPSRIGIKVEGIDYGWAPDGSIKKWDNKAFPELDVISVDFTFSARLKPDEASPPTRSQVSELSEKLDRLAIQIYNDFRSLTWVVLGIGVLMLLLRIFR